MITHTPLQAALTNYVATTEYPAPIPKVGMLIAEQLQQFNKFFTRITDEFGERIYYVGCEDGQHTFTDELGWRQYHLFIKQK